MNIRTPITALALGLVSTTLVGSANAQLRDVKEKISGNVVNEGIQKSLPEEIGAGRGDILTQTSSLYIIKRDPFRAIRRGRQLFQRKFLPSQGFGGRDRSGNIQADPSVGAGVVDSCAGCHGRPRGSAGHGGDVFTRPDSRDAPHLFGLGLQEQLGDEITTALRAQRSAAITLALATHTSQTVALTAKGISYGTLIVNSNGTVNTAGVVGVNPDLRVRPFFAQGGTVSIREFVVGAFNAEMGLQSDDPDLIAAALNHQRVTTPAGMVLDGTADALEAPPVTPSSGQDPDGDSIAGEMPVALVDYMEFYLLNYFKPAVSISPDRATTVAAGRTVFTNVGCTSCHMPSLTIDHDRRVADLDTVFSDFTPNDGSTLTDGNPINRLFSTATPRFVTVDDPPPDPVLKNPSLQSFVVQNFFADMKRHDLGPNFWERNFDGSIQKLTMTEPLWGVATTAPYGHDGRSQTLEEVILRHGGEAQAARDSFNALSRANKDFMLTFLNSLVLFSPDDTASNLAPINPAAANFPQNGHGAIALTALFNNTADKE
jgi:Di-haem oxidoreductase, putative peroxidase